jgi:hypothetical protein
MLRTLALCSSLVALSTAAAFGLSVAHGHYMTLAKPAPAPQAEARFAAPVILPAQPRPAPVASPAPTAPEAPMTLTFAGLLSGQVTEASVARTPAPTLTPTLTVADIAPAPTGIPALDQDSPMVISALSTRTGLSAEALAPRYFVGMYR